MELALLDKEDSGWSMCEDWGEESCILRTWLWTSLI